MKVAVKAVRLVVVLVVALVVVLVGESVEERELLRAEVCEYW